MAILWEFLKNPKRTGAIAASSTHLAKMIVSDIGIESASVIAEYGPGTGVFTSEILSNKADDATFFAIERSPKLAAEMRERFPEVTLFEDSAEKISSMLQELGEKEVDCIVCGLPWAAFDEELQDSLLSATLSVLSEGGSFATFAYLQGTVLPAGMRFHKKLKQHFSVVSKSPVVWRNLPPAFVYRCRK